MMTVRQIERWWESGSLDKLAKGLLASRMEDSPTLRQICRQSSTAAAALGMIRLDELNQSHSALYGRLLRHVLSKQQSDGGWDDPATGALALRALMSHHGTGAAIDGGLAHLAQLQRDDGGWPAVSIRRLPSDAFVTALVLHLLGDSVQFRQLVEIDLALAFLDQHAGEDAPAQRLHARQFLPCREAMSHGVN